MLEGSNEGSISHTPPRIVLALPVQGGAELASSTNGSGEQVRQLPQGAPLRKHSLQMDASYARRMKVPNLQYDYTTPVRAPSHNVHQEAVMRHDVVDARRGPEPGH